MTSAAQRQQVDLNYDRFQRLLATILPDHEGQFALMRDGEVVEFFDNVRDALAMAAARFPDDVFSLQEVTREPIDLGIFSHAGG